MRHLASTGIVFVISPPSHEFRGFVNTSLVTLRIQRKDGRRRSKRSGPAAHYCTFAVTDVAALMVNVQLLVLAPPLEHPPDHMTSRPLLAVRVTDVPVVKLALPLVPTLTL